MILYNIETLLTFIIIIFKCKNRTINQSDLQVLSLSDCSKAMLQKSHRLVIIFLKIRLLVIHDIWNVSLHPSYDNFILNGKRFFCFLYFPLFCKICSKIFHTFQNSGRYICQWTSLDAKCHKVSILCRIVPPLKDWIYPLQEDFYSFYNFLTHAVKFIKNAGDAQKIIHEFRAWILLNGYCFPRCSLCSCGF